MENGILSLSDLDSMSQDDIKMILGDSGLKSLHKKKFLKLHTEYKNGTFVPSQSKPEEQIQPQQPQQPQQQQNSMDPFGMMGGMGMGGMGGMMGNLFGGGMGGNNNNQQRKQDIMGGMMGGFGGMMQGMMGGMNQMMKDPNFVCYQMLNIFYFNTMIIFIYI